MSYRTLYETVIKSKLCCFCGACVAVCPHDALAFSETGPQLAGLCKECGNCMDACPGSGAPLTALSETLFHRSVTVDEEKRGLGIFIEDRDLISADPEIVKHGYTGGKVTALLAYLLEQGEIDAAIVASYGDNSPYPHFCWPKIAETRLTLLDCAGSKYTFSPNLIALKDVAHNPKYRSIAFLGVGCHVMGIRKLQLIGKPYDALVDKISYLFGIFCSGPLLYPEDLMRMVAKLCETEIEDIAAVDFKRVTGDSRFNVEYVAKLKNGQRKARKIWINDLFFMIKLLDQWPRCSMCMDYSAEFADISFGGAHIISRTPAGERLMQSAIAAGIFTASDDPSRQAFTQDAKMTDTKMIRAKKIFNFKRIKKNKNKQKPVPDFGITFPAS